MTHGETIDIPCDVQQVDGTGFVWTFLDETRDPARIAVGAVVVIGDKVNPALAPVVALTELPGGTKVHLDLRPPPWGPCRVRRRSCTGQLFARSIGEKVLVWY
jgi:hypothetical protein